MKLLTFLATAVLTVAVVRGQQPEAEQIKVMQDRYELEFVQLDAAETAALAPVLATYVKELGRLKGSAQAVGDLKAVLEFDELIAAVNAGTANEPVEAASPTLRTAFASYQRSRAAALRPFVTKRQKLEESYAQALTALEKRYTRNGQIEAAKLARDAKAVPPGTQAEVLANMSGIVLKNQNRVRSDKTYKPPIEIEWRFQTDGDTRLGYAFDQLIFNWGPPPHELRIDGGPVSGQHKKGEGAIPANKSVTVKLTVLPKQMTVSVDGRERARWAGDFSTIDNPVSIRAHVRSTVTVEQVVVRKLK